MNETKREGAAVTQPEPIQRLLGAARTLSGSAGSLQRYLCDAIEAVASRQWAEVVPDAEREELARWIDSYAKLIAAKSLSGRPIVATDRDASEMFKAARALRSNGQLGVAVPDVLLHDSATVTAAQMRDLAADLDRAVRAAERAQGSQADHFAAATNEQMVVLTQPAPTAPAGEPMKMLVDREWLKRKIAADPDDAECEAGWLHAPAGESDEALIARATDAARRAVNRDLLLALAARLAERTRECLLLRQVIHEIAHGAHSGRSLANCALSERWDEVRAQLDADEKKET